jgi:hypothetical protein
MDIHKVKSKHAASLRKLPNVKGVGIGYRIKNGKATEEVCVRVCVQKKLSPRTLRLEHLVPKSIDNAPVDVVEVDDVSALSLTHRERPSRCGISFGHPKITAGTQGAVVRLARDNDLYVVTNNHVAADSNQASIGDESLQPGPLDGGRQGIDAVALLSDYVKINFVGEGDKKKKSVARAWWGLWRGVANAGAAAAKCSFRAPKPQKVLPPGVIEQPSPNLVDVALCKAIEPLAVSPETIHLGHIQSIQKAQLGDIVTKTGRTTERRVGRVDGVNTDISVSYGGTKIAEFKDQLMIVGLEGDFSQGGDSGSAIHRVDDDNLAWCALLFAGSTRGQTFANRIEDVMAYLPTFVLA